jgi:hypothetical protein
MRILGALALLATLASHGAASEILRTEDREPCANHEPLRRPWFGDLHVHTRHSLDASTQGTQTSPRDAYRLARGQRIDLHPFDANGKALRSVQLDRPLDFAGVTDHAELFGETHICNTPESAGYDSLVCRIYRGWPRLAFFFMNARGMTGDLYFSFCGADGSACQAAARTPWGEMQEAAEEAYDRSASCTFTSFVAYEWTKSVGTGSNLHRNVVFRNERAPELPLGANRATTPQALWDALDACRTDVPGCEAVVIPHNSNLSSGHMFEEETLDGKPFDAAYAQRRIRNEPLVELTQHKGDSECRRGVGTEDELCDFELLPYADFGGRFARFRAAPVPASNFVRTALGRGLALEGELGTNPFQFGVIGSTDTHLGTPGLVSEKGYPGHGGAGTPAKSSLPAGLLDPIEYNPGGLAVVWAEENSRDALFAGLQRRETYSTTGPRITLRTFAGFGLDSGMCDSDAFAAQGYAGGVPMGGELPSTPPARASGPAIAAWALQDPGVDDAPGMPLQRLQVIKLSLGASGVVTEKVIDIAGDENNGASVDVATCRPTGAGFEQLCQVWRDPEFDPSQPSLYYTRAVENPSCRWSAYACNEAKVDCGDPSTIGAGFEPCCDPAFPKTIQERAVSSPIWFTPGS